MRPSPVSTKPSSEGGGGFINFRVPRRSPGRAVWARMPRTTGRVRSAAGPRPTSRTNVRRIQAAPEVAHVAVLVAVVVRATQPMLVDVLGAEEAGGWGVGVR